MASTKPYLIRAIHEWCVDEGFTPYLAVQVDALTRVPLQFVQDGQIVLNMSPDATHLLLIGNEEITFQTRFNGASFPVSVPVEAVLAIYARENGQGMAFEAVAGGGDYADVSDDSDVIPDQTSATSDDAKLEQISKRGGHLTRIK